MGRSSSTALKRSWADLDDGPAGLIADRVLAYDVAGYVRFRAVCRAWRLCSAERPAHGGLDRRFHPRRWVGALLREELATPDRRRFLNTSTGECVQVDLPELRDHDVLAATAEGLLVLAHVHNHKPRATVRLLNPLTRRLTELPPLTTLLPKKLHVLLSYDAFDYCFQAWGSGVLGDDDSTVVLCFNKLDVAKPGDACWTRVRFKFNSMKLSAGSMVSVAEEGTPCSSAYRGLCLSVPIGVFSTGSITSRLTMLETEAPRMLPAARRHTHILLSTASPCASLLSHEKL